MMTISKRLLLIAMAVIVLSASGGYSQGRGDSYLVTFEGTLVKFSPHLGAGCGGLYVHQVAKYRVNRILSGNYAGNTIVVDHPACDENVFKNVPIGSRVKVTVRVWRDYLVTTNYPGIRSKTPKVWNVAESSPPSAFVPPSKIEGP